VAAAASAMTIAISLERVCISVTLAASLFG